MSAGRRPRGDRGVAALEAALVTTLLLTLLAGVVPLAAVFEQRVQLGRTSGDVVRFATARADVPRTVGTLTVPRHRLPSDTVVAAEARRAWGSPAITTGIVRTPDARCPNGRRLRLSLTVPDVPSGPFAALLGQPTRTLRASTTSCEE